MGFYRVVRRYMGVAAQNPPEMKLADRAPLTTDLNYPIGTLWVDEANNASYQLTSVVSNAANWEPASIPENFLRQTTTTLSATQIKALRATPITVVAAQGAGTIIEYVGAQLKLNAGSEVFTETADNLAIRFVDGSGAIVSETIETTGFIDQSADTYTNSIAKVDNIIAAATGENAALVIHNTGDGEIAGNASDDATLDIIVTYRVHTI